MNQKPAEKLFSKKRLLIFFSLLVIASVTLQFNHLILSEFIRFSPSFTSAGQGLYISRSIPESHEKYIRQMLYRAERRTAEFWNGKQGSPKIIVCGRTEEYEKYCHGRAGAGCSLGTPWGSSFIVLSAQGINPDVISHEMSHVELFHRLGWRKTTFGIPQWFNEGLSMMLDYRFVRETDSLMRFEKYKQVWLRLTAPPARHPDLNDLATIQGFTDSDYRSATISYITAATEVSYWLMLVGRKGLTDWLQMTGEGRSFDAYYEIESASLRNFPGDAPFNPVRVQNQRNPGP